MHYARAHKHTHMRMSHFCTLAHTHFYAPTNVGSNSLVAELDTLALKMTLMEKLEHALTVVLPPKVGDSIVKLERKHRISQADIEENELVLNVLITARLTAKTKFRSYHIHQVLCDLYKQRGKQLSREDIAWLGEEASSIMSLIQNSVLSIKRAGISRSIPLGRLRAMWAALGGWTPPKAQCEPFTIPAGGSDEFSASTSHWLCTPRGHGADDDDDDADDPLALLPAWRSDSDAGGDDDAGDDDGNPLASLPAWGSWLDGGSDEDSVEKDSGDIVTISDSEPEPPPRQVPACTDVVDHEKHKQTRIEINRSRRKTVKLMKGKAKAKAKAKTTRKREAAKAKAKTTRKREGAKAKAKTTRKKTAVTPAPTTPKRTAATPTLTPEKTAPTLLTKRKVEEVKQGASLPGFPGKDASDVIYHFLQEHRPLGGPGRVSTFSQRETMITQLTLGQQAVAQAVPTKFNGSEVLAMQVLNTLLAAGWSVENVRAAKRVLLEGPRHNAD